MRLLLPVCLVMVLFRHGLLADDEHSAHAHDHPSEPESNEHNTESTPETPEGETPERVIQLPNVEDCHLVACNELQLDHLSVHLPRTLALVPAGSDLSLECHIRIPLVSTAKIQWGEMITTQDGDGSTNTTKLHLEFIENTIPNSGTGKKLIINRVTAKNISDGHLLTCIVTVNNPCCQHSRNAEIRVYTPSPYSAELVIVAAIAFIELIAILSLRSWVKSRKNNKSPSATNYSPLQLVVDRELDEIKTKSPTLTDSFVHPATAGVHKGSQGRLGASEVEKGH